MGLNSVDGPKDEAWNEAWAQELDRRSAAVERGEEPLELWEAVEARIRADMPLR
jgi:hypothetical protein